jgi:hypothetical protein
MIIPQTKVTPKNDNRYDKGLIETPNTTSFWRSSTDCHAFFISGLYDIVRKYPTKNIPKKYTI